MKEKSEEKGKDRQKQKIGRKEKSEEERLERQKKKNRKISEKRNRKVWKIRKKGKTRKRKASSMCKKRYKNLNSCSKGRKRKKVMLEREILERKPEDEESCSADIDGHV